MKMLIFSNGFRFACCAVVSGLLVANATVAQDTSSRRQVDSQSKTSSDDKFDASLRDFSKAPPIPDFEHPTEAQIKDSIKRGVDFLLSVQNKDGSWGSYHTRRDFEIYAPIPGSHDAFRAAVTGLAVAALLDTAPNENRVVDAVEKASAWFDKELPKLKRATGDAIYNVWGHAYAIRGLVRLGQQPGVSDERIEELKKHVEDQLEMLTRFESVDGGWGYYDFRAQTRKPSGSSIGFVNATVLLCMLEAKAFGVEPDPKIVERAIAATNRQKKPDFTYLYGEYLKTQPMRGINRPGGSLARSQACNLALRRWGDTEITENVLKTWLTRLYTRNGWLDIGRKLPVPHESWMQVSGYFYYYGHFYAGLTLEELKPDEKAPYQAMLARILIDHQEKNGCWWDYPMYNYHRQYGTAYSLMALQRCLPE